MQRANLGVRWYSLMRTLGVYAPEPAPGVVPTIQPVTEVPVWEGVLLASQSPVGTGTLALWTVPQGEEWELSHVTVYRGSGTRLLTGLLVLGTAGDRCQILEAASVAQVIWAPPGGPVKMSAGWVLQAEVSGGAADGEWVLRAVARRRQVS